MRLDPTITTIALAGLVVASAGIFATRRKFFRSWAITLFTLSTLDLLANLFGFGPIFWWSPLHFPSTFALGIDEIVEKHGVITTTVGYVLDLVLWSVVIVLGIKLWKRRRIMMNHIAGVLVALVLLSGCATSSRHAQKCTSDYENQFSAMEALGLRAAEGDLTAIDELEITAKELYKNITFGSERERTLSNLKLMRAAFSPIGTASGEGSEAAFDALVYAHSKEYLRSFTPDAFGLAAGMGNTNALNYLLNYKVHGLYLSSVVFALQPAAEQNIPEAVDFLIQVIENPKHKPLWDAASRGLAGAAAQGNQEAEDALKRYALNYESRESTRK